MADCRSRSRRTVIMALSKSSEEVTLTASRSMFSGHSLRAAAIRSDKSVRLARVIHPCSAVVVIEIVNLRTVRGARF